MRRAVARLLTVVLACSAVPALAGPGLAVGSQASELGGTTTAGADRPNIVLITTDDQTVADLQHMPLTRGLLGGQGVTFSDAISPYPLCCPARATLMTGQHAHNHGVLANEPPDGGWEKLRPYADRTLPVWLQDAGYLTAFTGKFLNTYGEVDRHEVPPGWDEWHATVGGTYDYDDPVVNSNGVVTDRSGTYQADLTQDVTAAAIRRGVQEGRPFFVWQSNLAPHGSCDRSPTPCLWLPPKPAPQDVGTFAGLPLHTEDDPSFNERVIKDKPARMTRRPLWDARQVQVFRDWNQANAESLQAVDRNVRDTVKLLEDLGQLDNTLIIFSSDNGFMLGEHRWLGKVLAYEPSLKIPMLMRGPGVPAGKVVDEQVSLVDVTATVAEAAGATPALTLDGVSLRGVAVGKPGYDAIAIESGASVPGVPAGEYLYRGVRTPRYTFLRHTVTGELELYDRRLDPYQLDNVAYRPTHLATRRALALLADDLADCAGADCYVPSANVPDPLPPEGPVHPDQLGSIGQASQLVTVTAPRWGATRGTALVWARRDRTWRVVRGPVTVRLGEEGLAPPRLRRTPGTTPAGTYRLAAAMGVRRDPGGPMAYRRLEAPNRWPDDRLSPRTYRVLQPYRSPRATWRPRREVVVGAHPGSFDRALVLDQNLPRRLFWAPARRQFMARRPADVRRGALLVHTGRRVAGQGWIGMPTRDLTWLLRWVDPAARGTRIVVGPPSYLRDRL